MKFLRLDLIAFGPFTGVSVDLGKGREGLHVIYGPNEAGKSSALRAIRQMLFGIPGQTSDAFHHSYKDLRVGAHIRDAKGEELKLIRRKANARTLRGPDDDSVIDEVVLLHFLGGVDEDTFQTMFGIDNAMLVEGGKAIVEGEGDIGAVLFAAGAGLADLRKVQQILDSEANGLFLPKGSTRPINQALTELDALRRKVKEHTLAGSDWLSHDQALRDALERKEAVSTQLAEKQRSLIRLERIRSALPAIAKRKELVAELEHYADTVLLPSDFGNQRLENLLKLQAAQTDEREASEALAEMNRQVSELSVPDALLEQAELIEQLHERLGSHKKALLDRSVLETEHKQLEADARTILRDLGGEQDLSAAESLRLTAAQRCRIQELGNERKALAKDCDNALTRMNDIRARIEEAHRELAELVAPHDPTELQKSTARIQKQGSLEEQRETVQNELARAEKQAQLDLHRLQLWPGTLEELEKLAIPTSETIDRFEDELNGLAIDVRTQQIECDELEAKILELDQQIQQMELRQAVPTEEDLKDARRRRDADWQRLRQNLQQAKGESLAELSEAHEANVQHTDAIADRLRREADQVAAKARCLADRNRCEQDFAKTKKQLDQIEAQLNSTRSQWGAVWQPLGIDPLPPKEMRAWVRKHEALLKQALDIQNRRDRLADLGAQIDQHRVELNRHLLSLGEQPVGQQETLAVLLDRGIDIVERLKTAARKRQELTTELGTLERKRDQALIATNDAEEKLRQWKTEWSEAMEQLRLDTDATPSQANVVLGCLGDLFEKLGGVSSHRRRIEGIDRDDRQFTADVADLTQRLAPQLDGCPAEQAVVELNASLTRARTAQAKLDTLTRQLATTDHKLKEARRIISACQGLLEVMCREARCSRIEELAETEQRSTRRADLEGEFEQLEDQLLSLSAGAALTSFLSEAEAVDPDALAEQISQTQTQINDLHCQKSELDQAIGREREILTTMKGSDQAAGAEEQVQLLLAKINSDTEHYVRLRLASVVLRDAIERYREKNQGPVLKRANDLFADLTVGSFEGLRVDVNDAGKPVLVGVRAGTREIVSVHEGMSDGTTDQLYLALRLASLETYLDNHEPVPFIADDLLINFDNDRAVAALKALAQLSERTQVLFFTHHEHLVELARTTLDDDVLFVHQLGQTSAAVHATGTTLRRTSQTVVSPPA